MKLEEVQKMATKGPFTLGDICPCKDEGGWVEINAEKWGAVIMANYTDLTEPEEAQANAALVVHWMTNGPKLLWVLRCLTLLNALCPEAPRLNAIATHNASEWKLAKKTIAAATEVEGI